MDTPDARQRGPGRGTVALLLAAFFLVEGTFRFGYFWLGGLATGRDVSALDPLVSELTGSVAALVMILVVVIPVSLRYPLGRGLWTRHLPVHVLALVVGSILKTVLMGVQRLVLFPLVGLGSYDYGIMVYRFPMEFSNDVFLYALTVAAVHAWLFYRAAREREIRTARLETRLAEARLEALQAQLRPHFLFNTLNTVSSVMYRSPQDADRILSRLSDLLRASLEAPAAEGVSLAEELATLEHYLAIMRARYGPRLRVELDVHPEAAGVEVPSFLLQPLVENAVEHGVGMKAGTGTVRVAITKADGRLELVVEDDGPGLTGDPEEAVGRGVGLANTRERLRHLYGDEGRLVLENRPRGGCRVRVTLPWRAAREPTDV